MILDVPDVFYHDSIQRFIISVMNQIPSSDIIVPLQQVHFYRSPGSDISKREKVLLQQITFLWGFCSESSSKKRKVLRA